MQVVPLKRPVNQNCVEKLEQMLADAKDGTLQDVAACGVLIDGSVMTAISSSGEAVLRLAAASRLLHRMHLNMDEATEEMEPKT